MVLRKIIYIVLHVNFIPAERHEPPVSLILAILFGVPLQDGAQFGLQNSCQFFGGFLQEGAAGVDAADVQVQVLLRGARVAAVLAHVQLVPPLLVGVLLLHAVDLLQV